MIISIATLFPDLYKPFIKTSLIKRAIEKNYISINLENMFDFAQPKKRIDAPKFGPGAGMLIRPEIVQNVIEKQEEKYGRAFKIFFSPQGQKLDQVFLKNLVTKIKEIGHMMLITDRYEGMDARVVEYYSDCTISIGDYVLMGGDLPAMVLLEGLLRLLPSIVAKAASVEEESFTGPFVDYPEYTVPIQWLGYKVPDVLRSGNHNQINLWRREQAIKRSVLDHFEWVRSHVTSRSDINDSLKFIPDHYVVLMHSDVVLEGGQEGESSVTSIDIHDIARSSCTFGIKKYFIVTPLVDQQKIIKKLLDFWIEEKGISYNINRAEALKNVYLANSLDEVIGIISDDWKKIPILIGTTAQKKKGIEYLMYDEQKRVWSLERPVLFILGTARGLAPGLLDKCDFILEPINGFSEFNHLSVRSAAAVIFDRWLGINLTSRLKTESEVC